MEWPVYHGYCGLYIEHIVDCIFCIVWPVYINTRSSDSDGRSDVTDRFRLP